jgi:hypothetical protein
VNSSGQFFPKAKAPVDYLLPEATVPQGFCPAGFQVEELGQMKKKASKILLSQKKCTPISMF